MAINKYITMMIMTLSLLMLVSLVGCGDKESTTNASITGVLKLSDRPNGPWDGIIVSVSGPLNFSNIETNIDGSFTVPNLTKSGAYTVNAGKDNYIVAAINTINVVAVKVYDIRDYLGHPSGDILVSQDFRGLPLQ